MLMFEPIECFASMWGEAETDEEEEEEEDEPAPVAMGSVVLVGATLGRKDDVRDPDPSSASREMPC